MTAIHEEIRFDRLYRPGGFSLRDKERFESSLITIITDGVLGGYIAAPLVSSGISRLRLVGASSPHYGETLWKFPLEHSQRVEALAGVLHQFYPPARIAALHTDLSSRLAQSRLRDSTIIIDATNDLHSKECVFQYGREHAIPVLSFSTCTGRGICSAQFDRDSLEPFTEEPQDELVSIIIGALAAEEAKKVILKEEARLDGHLHYTVGAENVFCSGRGYDLTRPDLFSDKRVLVIGAGGLFNSAIYGLCKMGFRHFGIIDDDILEPHNLMRTPNLLGHVGEYKAEVGAAVVQQLVPDAHVAVYVDKFKRDFKNMGDYDLVVGCVDNMEARGEAYLAARDAEIPILDAGSDFTGFNVSMAIPYVTTCLECQSGGQLLRMAREERERHHCWQEPSPSNGWMNQAAGMIMASLTLHIFGFDEVAQLQGPIIYDSKTAQRGFTLRHPRYYEACSCSSR